MRTEKQESILRLENDSILTIHFDQRGTSHGVTAKNTNFIAV